MGKTDSSAAEGPDTDGLSKAIKLLPGLTVAAAIASLVYSVGYFLAFGLDWIRLLTWKDIVATASVILPIVAIYLGWTIFSHWTLVFAVIRLQPFHELNRRIGKWMLIVAVLAGLLSLPGSTFPFVSQHPVMSAASVLFFQMTFVTIGMGLYMSGRRASEISLPDAVMLVSHVCVIVFLFGLLTGVSKANAPPRTIITFVNGRDACGTVVYSGDRGVLVHELDSKTTTLIVWGRIVAVSRVPECTIRHH